MFTPYFRRPQPLLRLPPLSCLPAFAVFVPLLAVAILIGPAPVQDPRPVAVPGPGCQVRLADAEATLVATAGRDAPGAATP